VQQADRLVKLAVAEECARGSRDEIAVECGPVAEGSVGGDGDGKVVGSDHFGGRGLAGFLESSGVEEGCEGLHVLLRNDGRCGQRETGRLDDGLFERESIAAPSVGLYDC
jgi:hypothetical protein